MKTKKPLSTKISKPVKKTDLRHGMHGSLMVNAIDAGQSEPVSDSDLKLATPDLGVAAGQVTHE
jgi:hypothetical protein